MARHKLDAFYDGVCSIVGYERLPGIVDRVCEVMVGENLPCHLDFDGVRVVQDVELGAKVVQGVTLFLAPEVVVAPGSRVIVVQNGVRAVFVASGKAAVYRMHQEVPLRLVDGWA